MADDFEFNDEPFIDEDRAPKLIPEAAPRKARTTSTAKAKTTNPPPAYKAGVLIEPLSTFYGMLGMGIGMFEMGRYGKEDMPIGTAIVESAESCAMAWDKAAKTSPAIRRIMYRMAGSSNTIALVTAHAPIAIAVANQSPAIQNMAKRVTGFVERLVNAPASEQAPYEYS